MTTTAINTTPAPAPIHNRPDRLSSSRARGAASAVAATAEVRIRAFNTPDACGPVLGRIVVAYSGGFTTVVTAVDGDASGPVPLLPCSGRSNIIFTVCRSDAISLARAYRSFGFFCSARVTISCSASGRSGIESRSGVGSACMI